ncbi:hypothetical protein CBR_g53624 [Chara braunii]|uniref:Reverse transcriptase n=1 Tax=Chara braunii TaxID=69332 RepID=A0A388MB13_CHABU|nr:hypothetical protein CBR_g53624 [Chara braunii]|eukprot:GBG91771.1 hypothetical protein CBR_g53624 [Chara braunii]
MEVTSTDGAPETEKGFSALPQVSHDLVATCAVQEEEILHLEQTLDQMLARVQALEKQPAAVAGAEPSTLTTRVQVLEDDVNNIKRVHQDFRTSQQATNLQLETQVQAAATVTPAAASSRRPPKLDDIPVFCDQSSACTTDLVVHVNMSSMAGQHLDQPRRSSVGTAHQAHLAGVDGCLAQAIPSGAARPASDGQAQQDPSEYAPQSGLDYRVPKTPRYKANRHKCEFVRQELEYLGHFVSPEGIRPLVAKIQAIPECPETKNVTDVRSFLGLAGYYQRFIKGYLKIAANLSKLQSEERPFDFYDNACHSFETLKAALSSAEVLHIYDLLLATRVTTDASGYGIGAVLEQHDGTDWHPVEYFSKKVPPVHSIDDARKKELLAFVHALKRWRHFLLGRKAFRWVTDNNPLVFYKSQDTINSTIARWMAFIDQFDFFPDHIPGKSNRFADALSRRPDLCSAVYSTFEIEDDLRESFIRAYQADPHFRDKYANCSSPNPVPSHYRIQEGYLLVHSRGKDLLCVPNDSHLRTRLLGKFHDAPASGHFGVNRTLGRLRQRFYWADLLKDATRYLPDRPISHEIILEAGTVPPKGCIYRMSEEELTVVRAQLNDLLNKGWIRPSSSPYGAPVLFVRKKNKDLRLCIDYRRLNAQTIRNAGPLPRIDDLLERLGDAKYFSKLDLKSGYHQISIRPQDRYKTAFKTRYGHFEWVVMPFGLTNAPATFQATINTEFRAMLDRLVLVYLDDILVYNRTLEEHLNHLRRVLETLRSARYKANRDKCEFVRQELEYLGHFVSPEGIRPLVDKIQAIPECPETKNVTDVRSFLGLAGYYQRFIKGYSKSAANLSKLQSEDRPFDFDDNACHSFETLKAALLSAEELHIYDPLLATRVTTYASGYGIGAVLEQHDGTDWHPVEYFSKKVPSVHSIDDARKKELLAFIHAFKRWRHFLLGRKAFRWVTDNNPLVFNKSQDTINSTIARWMAFIDQFDFFPVPGKSNRFADALSRRPDLCTAVYSTFEIEDDLRESFIRGYQADPHFRDKYANGSSPNPVPSHYRIQEGYLLVHSRGKDLLCMPNDSHLRTRLLGKFHDVPASGHFGVNRTLGRLPQRFYWPDLLKDATRYYELCEVCRRCKSRNHRPFGELHPLPVPLGPREAIAMDITCPFPKHKTGVDGILTVVDRLTKYAIVLPCSARHAQTGTLVGFAPRARFSGWIRSKGYPKQIIWDRDTRFLSDFWVALVKR